MNEPHDPATFEESPVTTPEGVDTSAGIVGEGCVTPSREVVAAVVEEMLSAEFPQHEVDQFMASMRDLTEFKVVLHEPEGNQIKTVQMWSTDFEEATIQAVRSFEHDGWHLSRIARDCTECYGGQWWLDPEAPVRPLPFTDEEMWGPGLAGRVRKVVGTSMYAVSRRLTGWGERVGEAASRL